MKKVNVLGKLGLAAAFTVALSVGACNSPAPEAAEEETTEEAAATEEHDHEADHDHDHEGDEHSAGEEHPTGGDGGSEHPN